MIIVLFNPVEKQEEFNYHCFLQKIADQESPRTYVTLNLKRSLLSWYMNLYISFQWFLHAINNISCVSTCLRIYIIYAEFSTRTLQHPYALADLRTTGYVTSGIERARARIISPDTRLFTFSDWPITAIGLWESG